ncbi:CLUMA_CG013272, isoform A [Clunio marinus]|uniref:CLUMA_CG013272, isoform A n=1 Tax=Clunio marinus TaxID=568069 RepID=A0A1J1IJN8_9DIPT|nr:CLUMA_CG013272, isoform A [Clunio marinus]
MYSNLFNIRLSALFVFVNFIVICYSQIVVQNDANSNFYSVAMPSAQISFQRYFPGAAVVPNNVVPNNRLVLSKPISQPVYQPQQDPYNIQQIDTFRHQVHPQVERAKLSQFSFSPEVSSVRFSSNGLNYNF